MTDLFLSVFWYGGLMLAAAGFLFTLRPVKRLGVPTRRRAVRIAIYRALTWVRVYATDAATRRVFNVYWRTIDPGSALIRASWLRPIKRRAELPLG